MEARRIGHRKQDDITRFDKTTNIRLLNILKEVFSKVYDDIRAKNFITMDATKE